MELALLAVIGSQVALVAVVWRALRDAPVRREQEHAFLWGVIERYRMESIDEMARAEVIRSSIKEVEQEIHAPALDALEAEAQSFNFEIDEGRRAMLARGFDPDDDEQVVAWNQRYGH